MENHEKYSLDTAEKYVRQGVKMATEDGGIKHESVAPIYHSHENHGRSEIIGFDIRFEGIRYDGKAMETLTRLAHDYLREEENRSSSRVEFYERTDGRRDRSRRAVHVVGRHGGRRTELWFIPNQQPEIHRCAVPQTIFGYFDGGINRGVRTAINKDTWERHSAVPTSFKLLTNYRPSINYDIDVRIFEPEGYDFVNRAYTASMLLSKVELPPKGIRYARTIEALLLEQQEKVGWSDLGGIGNLYDELFTRIIGPSLNPEFYSEMKLKPSNVLLTGPPGVGKTSLCNIIINEARGYVRVPFKPSHMPGMCADRISVDIFFSWLDEISNDTNKHVLLVYDDIEDMGSRFEGDWSKTVHAWLRALDGSDVHHFSLIGTTNKPSELDPAFFRPGRIDRIYYIGPPDVKARREILDIHARRLLNYDKVDTDKLAKSTEGYTGAELADIFDSCKYKAISERAKCSDIRRLKTADIVVTQEMLEKNIAQNREHIREKTERWEKTFTEEFKGKNKDISIISMFA